MNSLAIILLFVCAWTCVQAQQDEDALRECGNLHHLEFRNLPNANATFSNRNCMLKCSVSDKTLSDDALNEGFPCPLDSYGVCHNGQCIGSQSDALRECSNIHHIDMHKTHSSGSNYANNQCSLRCVVSGSIISENALNEGFVCPTEPNGICRNGRCVLSNQPSVTTVLPGTFTPPSSSHVHNITEVHVQIMFANFTGPHDKLSAIACVDEAHQARTQYSYKNCHKSCSTNIIALPTRNPEWNFHCFLNGPFANKEDFLLVTVFEQYQNVNHEVGVLGENLQSIYNRLYSHSTHHTTSDMYYKDNFQILRSMNNGAHIANMTMEIGIVVSSGH